MQPNLYLFFNGNCFEAMSLYADLLGGKIDGVIRNSEAPDEESRMPGGDDMVMHLRLELGDTTIMASDSPPEFYNTPQGFRVQIEPDTLEEFDRLYAALSEDARAVDIPPGETFWAKRFAMVTDRFGTPWMLNYDSSENQA